METISIEKKEIFKTEIQKLKNELKEQAKSLTERKRKLKEDQRKFKDVWRDQGEVLYLKYQYRIKHIAYCELRGKTRDQIEPKVREGNEPNQSKIDAIKLAILSKLQ